MSSASGDDGQIGSFLRALGIFDLGPKELGGSVFKDCIAIKTWALAGCSNGQEVVIYVS